MITRTQLEELRKIGICKDALCPCIQIQRLLDSLDKLLAVKEAAEEYFKFGQAEEDAKTLEKALQSCTEERTHDK